MRFQKTHPFILGTILSISALSLGAAKGAAEAGDSRIDDNDILEAVEGDLQFDDAVPDHQIHVQVREGIVTLSGRSHTLFGKRRAQRLVEALKGVRAVVNQIRVVSSGRSDNEILSEVRAALNDDPVADLDELQVEVVDGVVTLRGEADSHAERLLTEETAVEVRGVVKVKNQITVDAKQHRPDDEIRPEVESRLANNPWLAAGSIKVEVRNGHVTLSGTVGSVHDKSIARLSSWVAGVRDVDDSGLKVEGWLDLQSRRDSSPPLRNDLQVQRAVQDALLYDPRLCGSEITVHVRGGAVSLLGSVSTLSARQAASEDAENTLGVRRVINHLKVKPAADWPGDAAVTRRATEALARDAVLSWFDLQVSSHFGKVYLRGEVDNSFQKYRAAAVVANVPGVLRVINRITVDAVWEPKPDEDIKEDITRRLRWSPLLDSEVISVAVTDGVAILMGTVNTYQERSVAERYARQGGARRVVNELKVRADRTAPGGLKATLIPQQEVYELKAERSGEAFRRLLRTAERNRHYELLPPAPEVDLIFQLENQSDRPIDVRLGHDSGGFEIMMAGDGAEHIRLERTFPGDFQMGAVVTVEPGADYRIPIRSLQYGFRGATDRWYWTEPGQYTLHITLTWPAERRGLFGQYAVTAPPLKVTAKPK
jgi:osmotically-inducible protein OsmY